MEFASRSQRQEGLQPSQFIRNRSFSPPYFGRSHAAAPSLPPYDPRSDFHYKSYGPPEYHQAPHPPSYHPIAPRLQDTSMVYNGAAPPYYTYHDSNRGRYAHESTATLPHPGYTMDPVRHAHEPHFVEPRPSRNVLAGSGDDFSSMALKNNANLTPIVHNTSSGDQQPTYVGHIKSAQDAILLLSACDLPSNSVNSTQSASAQPIPPPRRVTRRLLDAERADLVASGCVFAWDEKEAGMKRWTDGRVWSASRVSGCFLTYRELDARKKANNASTDGPSSNQYKTDGLIKQSFSTTTASGRKLHVISYFTKRDVREGRLRRVSEDPRFVGEGGGEWGLKINDEEYLFSDGSERSAPSKTAERNEGEEGVDVDDASTASAKSEYDVISLSETKSESPLAFSSMAPPTLQHNLRKRSVPDDSDVDKNAYPNSPTRSQSRPRLTRVRSSSLGNPSGGSKGSFQSTTTSLDTSVPSDSEISSVKNGKARKGEARKSDIPVKSFGLSINAVSPRSSAIRALVSPTIPRESAIRGSACEMQPTQSQDSANAVGALLSLAGGKTNHQESSRFSPSSSGLGLSFKTLPQHRDPDRAALNKFHVRL